MPQKAYSQALILQHSDHESRKKLCKSLEAQVLQANHHSPYTKSPVALHIGSEETVYYVPRHLLPSGWNKTNGEDSILLHDVEIEAGHTLVHYLYTGEYQTLDAVVSSTLDACGGLKRALLVYIMAKDYNLIWPPRACAAPNRISLRKAKYLRDIRNDQKRLHQAWPRQVSPYILA
jgi:hypothetical protein